MSQRKLVRLSDGTLYAVYHRKYFGDYQIYVKKSVDGGANWSTSFRVSSGMGGYDQIYPSIAVDSNDYLHVVWMGDSSGYPNYQIWYAKYTTSWIAPVRISTYTGMDTEYQGPPSIAVDSNDYLHVVWEGYIPGATERLWYAKYITSWSTPERICDPKGHYPCIAVDSNDYLHVVWSGPGYRQVFHAKYITSWSTPVRISTYAGMESYHQEHTSIVVDSNDCLHIVWHGQATGFPNRQIWYAKYTTSWIAPVRISTYTGMSDYSQYHSSIAVDSSNCLHVIWDGAIGAANQIWYTKYTTAWSIPELLQATGVAPFPNLRWSNYPISNRVIARLDYVFTQGSVSPYNIRFAYSGIVSVSAADLPTTFRIAEVAADTYRPRYPIDLPFEIDSGVWGGLLRYPDPNLPEAYRVYVPRQMNVKMGATLSGGSFKVTFEDDEMNESCTCPCCSGRNTMARCPGCNSIICWSQAKDGYLCPYCLTISLVDYDVCTICQGSGADTCSLKNRFADCQEVWVGVQKGPYKNDWDGTTGRAWLLGGYIIKRYTEMKPDTRKVFVIEGLDYMVLMSTLIFGTPDDPKIFAGVDLGVVADAVAAYLATWNFSKAVAPGWDNSTGVTITKTYERFNKVSDILKDLVERVTPDKFDWYIDYLKRMYYHERGAISSGLTIDWTKLRSGRFMWGDSSSLITDVWATDGSVKYLPPDTLQWTLSKKDWEITGEDALPGATFDYFDWLVEEGLGPAHKYLVFSSASEAWGIKTQADPGASELSARFPVAVTPAGDYLLHADLRNYTHISFDFRKNPYRLGETYLFCLSGPGPMFHEIYYDWTSQTAGVGDNEWCRVEIKLPELDFDGNVTDWNGWVVVSTTPDLTDVSRLRFHLVAAAGQPLSNMSWARIFLSRSSYALASSGLTGPCYAIPKIKIITDKNLDSYKDAYERALYELEGVQNPLTYLNPVMDGDPRYLPGKTVTLNLISPFFGVDRIINEVTHDIGEDLVYTATLALSDKDVRVPSVGFEERSDILKETRDRMISGQIGKWSIFPE